MRRFLTALVAGVGMGLLIGGVCGLLAALATHEDINATGLGPLNGRWSPNDLRFLATSPRSCGTSRAGG
jgi:hypothetical protein